MQTLEPEVEQAVAVRMPEPKPLTTAAQAKVDAVANLTMKAYERASTLQLTPEEIKGLAAEFADDAFQPGAAGKEHLIYIEHAHLRDRLNSVIGVGQWALIPRNRWAEEFVTKKGTPGSRVYVEAMLVIRGAFVSESVGAMEYYPGNESQNYGDAVEGAKTAALRRCAKELGVGLQAWKKEFCDGWWKRKRGNRAFPPQNASQTATAPNRATPAPSDQEEDLSGTDFASLPKTKPGTPVEPPHPMATSDQRVKMIWELKSRPGEDNEKLVSQYFAAIGAILSTEPLNDVPLPFVPAMAKEMRELGVEITKFSCGDPAQRCSWMPKEGSVTSPEAKQEAKKADPVSSEPPMRKTKKVVHGETIQGIVDKVSVKTGASAKGPWTRCAVEIEGKWYSSFENHIKEMAETLEGKLAKVEFAPGKLGNDIITLEAA